MCIATSLELNGFSPRLAIKAVDQILARRMLPGDGDHFVIVTAIPKMPHHSETWLHESYWDWGLGAKCEFARGEVRLLEVLKGHSTAFFMNLSQITQRLAEALGKEN